MKATQQAKVSKKARAAKITGRHRLLAYKHAKQHVLEDLKVMFSDLISDEAHSIITASDGVDMNDAVVKYLVDFERRLKSVVREDSFLSAEARRSCRTAR